MIKFRFIMSAIWVLIEPWAIAMLTSGGKLLADTVQKIVPEIQDTYRDLDGDGKKDIAYKEVIAVLAKHGITFSKTIIYLAIEAAVLRMQANRSDTIGESIK